MTDPAELDARFAAAQDACTLVGWQRRRSPAEAFAELGRACEELGIDTWDGYGDRGAVARLESEVAELLGKPAAVFFVSGVMAQQVALRIWCERRSSRRVALPDLSHLLMHEDDGPRLLHDFRFEHLTTGRRTPTAADLDALPTGLGAVLVELPLREAGCLLPTWDELVGLSERARELEVPLHVDGARLWESQPHLGHPLAEIAALADTVYVSFYKGLGGLSGAVLTGPEDVMEEARTWRRRHGGTLYRMTPYAVSALAGLREHLPRMEEYVGWARALAGELVAAGLRVTPDPPHTNTFQVVSGPGSHGDEVVAKERLVELMERERVRPCAPWRPTEVPGCLVTEIAVHEAALDHDPAVVAGWVAGLVS